MPRSSRKKNSSLFLIAKIAGAGLLGLFSFSLLLFFAYAKDLPRPERLSEVSFAKAAQIYDKTGQVLLYELYSDQKREFVPLQDIPEYVQKAVIATEDANFYSHFGVDLKGVARAIGADIRLGSKAQGASTISQQLVRSSFLSTEKTASRKIKELILTLELERRYDKDQILEFYLNQIPFGSNAYGLGAASEMYFGKAPKDLSLAEGAALTALIRAPSYYSPFGAHRDALLGRKDYVLSRMQTLSFISPEESSTAKAEEIHFIEQASEIKAPHFVFHVIDELSLMYGEDYLRESGLRVITSLDWNLQQMAEAAINQYQERNQSFNAYNEALVAILPSKGEVVAMVGSKDWHGAPYPANCISGQTCLFDPKLNVSTYNQGRQPGSSFKPFVYAEAFLKGYDDKAIVIDEETNFGIWGGKEYTPQNYDGKFRGPVTIREALAQSLNIPAIKVLLDMAGLQDSISLAREFGIKTLRDASNYGPSLVLGGGEVRLIDMVSAYGVFATDGKKIPPVSILEVYDGSGEKIFQNTKTSIQIIDPKVTQMITSILSDNEARAPIFGPNSSLYFPDRTVAVKTGTTQEYRDAWTIGYTPNIVAGVWVGNNNNEAMTQASAMLAAPIWRAFMQAAIY